MRFFKYLKMKFMWITSICQKGADVTSFWYLYGLLPKHLSKQCKDINFNFKQGVTCYTRDNVENRWSQAIIGKGYRFLKSQKSKLSSPSKQSFVFHHSEHHCVIEQNYTKILKQSRTRL